MLRLIVQCDCETLTFLASFGTEYIALVPEQLTTFLQAEVPALIPGTAGSRAGKHSANNIEIMGFKGKHCTLLHQKWTDCQLVPQTMPMGCLVFRRIMTWDCMPHIQGSECILHAESCQFKPWHLLRSGDGKDLWLRLCKAAGKQHRQYRIINGLTH